MQSYLDLLRKCHDIGTRQKNRTGIDTFMIPGGMMEFDLAQGFPILTTKKVNFPAVVAELLGFIRGYTSAADFRRLGCKFWDANANQNKQWLENPHRKGEDDLGPIYGSQWRQWPRYGSERSNHAGHFIDQLSLAVKKITENPTDRRIIVTAWNPGEIHKMALPPCHLLYQFIVEQGRYALHMTMYQRSCDMFLGVPFNISSYALLLALVARATGLEPGKLTMFLADVHIYENHVKQVEEQLTRTTLLRPKLRITGPAPVSPQAIGPMAWLEQLEPAHIWLDEYGHHAPIKAEMAI
jgi:thymidylate synthase